MVSNNSGEKQGEDSRTLGVRRLVGEREPGEGGEGRGGKGGEEGEGDHIHP
jgi:hypothetical protein